MKREPISVGRPALLRHTNALTILNLLREVRSCSRADLMRASGMSAPTVTNVVKYLLAGNFVQPMGEGESSGGRPPDMISFKADRGCLLTVQILSTSLRFLLTDLSGDEIGSEEMSLARQITTPQAICRMIDSTAARMLRGVRVPRERLMAVVAAVPAIANVASGVVVAISTLSDWSMVPLRDMLSKFFDCAILIENDTNLAALGERHRGTAKGEQNFILINISDAVSAGIVLNGAIHHGAQCAAGEIAYLRLPSVSRKSPSLHEFGELESMLTSSGIVRAWQKSQTSKRGARSPQTAKEVLDLAEAGDPSAGAVLRSHSRVVADILLNFSLILNPGLMVVGGEVGSHPALLSRVRHEIEQCEFAVPHLVAAQLGESAVLWGGISLALDALPLILLPLPRS